MQRWLCAILTVAALGADPTRTAAGNAGLTIHGFRTGIIHKAPAKTASRPLQDDGYYVPYVTGPGGEKTSTMNIPSSVTVVPRMLMDDQQATTVCDALRNVSGVSCR